MATFDELIYRMYDVGFADVLLPFVLVFTVVFAIMQRTKVLGEDARRYNVIVAIVMGALVVFPHVLGAYPPWSDPVVIINNALPDVALVIVIIIMVLLLLGAFGAQLNLPEKRGLGTIIFFGAILVVGYIFAVNAGYFGGAGFPSWLSFLQDPDTQALIIMVLVFGALIWFITRESEADKIKRLGGADKLPKSEAWIKTPK